MKESTRFSLTAGKRIDMRLSEKQELFLRLKSKLLIKLIDICDRTEGLTLRDGDAFRDSRVHGKYGEKFSYSAAYSMHKLKLAQDLNLIFNGQLADSSHYIEIGEWWEKQHELCRWGGRFDDFGHFSLSHDGRA